MTYTKKMHEAARRETTGKQNIVTDLLDEIERLQNKKYGHVHQDDDGHWYLVPEDVEGFNELTDEITQLDGESEEWYNAINAFEEKFSEYRLSGGVESLRILMETK